MEYIQSVSTSDRKVAQKRLQHRVVDLILKNRFQLFGGLIFGVLAPAVVRGEFEKIGDELASYEHSIIGTVCALFLGYLIFRKMTVLPGARAVMSIVPAFLTSYAFVVAFFFLMRIDYSRQQFLLSFFLACIWFGTILFVMARFRRPVFYFLPGSQSDGLTDYVGVRWRELKSKKVLDRYPHLPLVVNFEQKDLDPSWQRIVAEEAISGRRILSAKQLAESLNGRVQIEFINENSFGHLAPDSLYAPLKRYLDIFSALLAIMLLWPILLIIGVVIRLETAGPAIFKQKRMGYQGRSFVVYKFRSMRVSSENSNNLKNDKTRQDDDRITRVGAFIRKTRLDELPQLFNILRGEMSWIGPRPETLNLSEWYESQIPFYRYRHIVRPGVSGWAQVKQGHVTEVDDIRLKLEYDMYYVKHFSIWLDLLIVAKTIAVVLTGRGAK